MRLERSISWFQSELVYYDASLWDKSVEQLILRKLGTKSKKECIFSKHRVDLDLLNGAAYKSKSKHDWSGEIWRGIKTTAFAPIHWDYWRRHTSPRMAAYIIFHFVLQLLQVVCFILLDPENTKVIFADVFVPLAMGLGLGILHAQITAYDPQRRTRTSSSRIAFGSPSLDSLVPEYSSLFPLQATASGSKTTFAPQAQSNISSRTCPISQPCCLSETITANSLTQDSKISSSPNRISAETARSNGLLKCSSHQTVEAKMDEAVHSLCNKNMDNSVDFLTEEGGKTPQILTSPDYRRRALSLKLVPHNHDKVPRGDCSELKAGIPFERKSSSGASSDADLKINQKTYEGKLNCCLRKRSASLSPSLSLSATPEAVAPLEEKIKHFKEAKMRGVTDPEVFANYQLKKMTPGPVIVVQKLSPPCKGMPKWKTRLPRMHEAVPREDEEEGDEESGGDEAEISDERENVLALDDLNSNKNDDQPPSLGQMRSATDRFSAMPLNFPNEDNHEEGLHPSEGGENEDEEDDDWETNDTLTTRRRQRARFLKLFLERASHHRHQQRGTHQAHRLLSGPIGLPEEAHVDEADAAPESVSHYHSLPLASVTSKSPAVTTTAATCRSAAQKRVVAQAVRTKLISFRKKTLSMDSVLSAANTVPNSGAHPTSETEYERMNSDVRSEYDSSSGTEDEQSALRGRASCLSASTQSSLPDRSTTSASNHHQQQQQLHVKISGSDDAVNGGGSSGISGAAAVSPGAADTKSPASPAEDPDGSGDDDTVGPFALWYLHTLQGFSDHSYVPLETVGCYVWEGKKLKKMNFTLLDIGWRIIQAVERQTVSMFYPKISCIVAFLLAVLPLFFHAWYQQDLGVFLVRPPQALANSGSLPEMHRTGVDVSMNPLSTPGTLAIFLYGWIANFVTHVFFASSDSLVDETTWHRFISLDNLVIGLGIWLRLNIYIVIFFLLSVAERAFQQRLLYAKHFFALTSSHRARRCRIPHLRLNKVAHVKCWLTLRSYLKKRGPQRSIECIITAAFYLAFASGLFLCARFLISNPSRRGGVFSSLAVWDILAYTAALSVFLLRFLTLGTKITKKFRNVSILITEQMNLNLCMNRKPHKKEELSITNQVLKLAENLLKEVDGPYRICGWAVNPLIYNIFKLVLLSCFSAFVSEILGFKLKLYKLKLNPANW